MKASPRDGLRAGRAPGAAGSPAASRLLVLLLVLGFHLAVCAVLLLPGVRQEPAVAPSIQAQLLAADREAPSRAPVLPPPSLEHIPIAMITPDVAIALPEPDASTAITAPAPKAAPAAVPSPTEPLTAPRFDAAYLKNPPPLYPAAALRRHEQGTTLLRVRVSAQGAPLEVLVEGSSGSPQLDEAAVAAVRQWRFVAAQRGSVPVEAWVLIPLEFALHRPR